MAVSRDWGAGICEEDRWDVSAWERTAEVGKSIPWVDVEGGFVVDYWIPVELLR